MSDRLTPDHSLHVGAALTSPNGRFTLVLQADGSLVLSWSGGAARWVTGTHGRTVVRATMQSDGNFVLYGPAGALWASGTAGHPGAFLAVQNDGNVVIYGQGGPLWATGTATRAVNDQEAAHYLFRLEKFHMTRSRALHADTAIVRCVLQVGNQRFGPLLKHMGAVQDGDHPVGLPCGPLPIASTAVPVLFTYQIVRSGHKDRAALEKLLYPGADALTPRATARRDVWETGAAWDTPFCVGMRTGDCDRPVVMDQITTTGAIVDAWTSESHTYSETRYYTDPSHPSGDASPEYKVTWSISRQSS